MVSARPVIVVPSSHVDKSRHRALASMRQVGYLVRRLRRSHDVDAVHDLRVAIRRCRSFASLMEEIDGSEGWRDVRRRTRPLFRALGALRELHVHAELLKDILQRNPLRAHLREALARAERAPRRVVRRELDAFRLHAWKRLRRGLSDRLAVRPGGLLARSLVADRHRRLSQLHRRAAMTGSVEDWHALRVALKRFRYALEAVWPDRSSELRDHLERLQQLLGAVHDLDVLDIWLAQRVAGHHNLISARRTLRARRRQRMKQYEAAFGRPVATLRAWARGLPSAPVAAGCRIRAMAVCMDARRRPTAAVVRMSRQLLRGWRRMDLLPGEPSADIGRLLHTAALLDDVAPAGRSRGRREDARRTLLVMSPPAGWTIEDWTIVSTTVGDCNEVDVKTVRRLERPIDRAAGRRLLIMALMRIARALAGNRILLLHVERNGRELLLRLATRDRHRARRACVEVSRRSRLLSRITGVAVRAVPSYETASGVPSAGGKVRQRPLWF